MSEDKGHSSAHEAAVELGHLGGIKGGDARKHALTSEERSAIASKAAKARWSKAKRKHATKKQHNQESGKESKKKADDSKPKK